MWHQLSNKNYSQMIDRQTPEEAVSRFHEVLDGMGAKYLSTRTVVVEAAHKFGATTMEGEVPVRFESIKDVQKHNENTRKEAW